MATKPSDPILTWATNTNYAAGPDTGLPTKVAPVATVDGHIGGSAFAPTAQETNYLINNQQQWADYFETQTDETANTLANLALDYGNISNQIERKQITGAFGPLSWGSSSEDFNKKSRLGAGGGSLPWDMDAINGVIRMRSEGYYRLTLNVNVAGASLSDSEFASLSVQRVGGGRTLMQLYSTADDSGGGNGNLIGWHGSVIFFSDIFLDDYEIVGSTNLAGDPVDANTSYIIMEAIRY